MTAADMASSDAGIQMLLAQIYSYIPMNAFGYEDQYTLNGVDSHGGDYGFNNDPYYGRYGLTTFSSWGNLRSINAFMDTVKEAQAAGVITEDAAKQYIAEAQFIRAYCYFVMVRSYGGVPILTEVLDEYYDGGENKELFARAERATEKDTWDFVLRDLDEAIAGLADDPVTEFRVGKYAAYGLKARVALYAASVSKFWDKQGALSDNYKSVAAKKTYMNKDWAPGYYDQCIAACEAIISSNKFSLYGADPADVSAAVENLGNMFLTKTSEYIFGKSMNDGISSSGDNFDVYNSPAQTVTGQNSGRYSVALDLVDLYDYYEVYEELTDPTDPTSAKKEINTGKALPGTIKTRTDGREGQPNVANSNADYIKNPIANFKTWSLDNYIRYDAVDEPFKNKDARFQAWILYPDSKFRNETIKIQGGLINTKNERYWWSNQTETVDATTYYAFGGPDGDVSGFVNYNQTMAANSGVTTGFGLRKFLNPQSFQLYLKTFWYDIRYAEILLTYCEAVLENNVTDKMDEAEEYLNDIRHRAAFTDDVPLTIENVLKERRLELAFENDYLYTLHRRRDFYNINNGDNPVMGNRHALTPVLDLSSGTPKYIFVRSLFFQEDNTAGGKQPSYSSDFMQYYSKMPDYGRNGYEPNPLDE